MAATIIPVLIADPHRQSLDLTMSIFRSLGLKYVWSADTIERTQNFLDAVIFDYVLLDSQLSGAHLNTLIASIRDVSQRTKVIVLSHLPYAQERFPGADIVFSKPISFEAIKQLLVNNQTVFIS